MLKKQYILRKNNAFKATYSNNVSKSNEFFKLYFGKLKEDPSCQTKVGFVVSKKNFKKAVIRNRVKRIMREVYRLFVLNNENIAVEKFFSLVFVCKSGLKPDFDAIKFHMLSLLED